MFSDTYGINDNPFGATIHNIGDTGGGGEESAVSDRDFVINHLKRAEASAVVSHIASVVSGTANVVVSVVADIAESIIKIIKSAVKMAVFKFAIELCAMGIKNLVEAMVGMSMTPPNIDTQGVFYNLQGNGSSSVISPVTSVPNRPTHSSSFGNPFGNPFQTANGW